MVFLPYIIDGPSDSVDIAMFGGGVIWSFYTTIMQWFIIAMTFMGVSINNMAKGMILIQ